MITCKITIKIKDYFPKIDTIPYENYICLFTCGENEGQIPFLPDDSQIIQHQIKNVTSDIKYKVHILDYNDMSLIGMCEMTISYQIINQLTPPNGFIQEQQKKVLIDLKTKRKLFGTIVNLGDIYLNIYAEVFLISRTNIEQKNNNKIKKNYYQNTPQCYIKYSFQMNQSDFSPKSSKNKISLINSNSEKHTLHNNHQEKCFTNKHSNYNLINYKSNKDKENNNDGNNKKAYSNFNNNIKKGFKNYSSRIQQKKISNNSVLKEQNRKNIMDLLQHKKMMEKQLEKENLEKEEKKEIESVKNDNNNDNNNDNIINKKDGYLTEQNFNLRNRNNLENKYIINNHKLKNHNKEDVLIYNKNNKIVKDGFKKNEKQNNEKYIKYNLSDEHNLIIKGNINNNSKLDQNIDIKNTLSPNANDIFNNKESEFTKNLSKTVKTSKVPENNNNQYIYQSKNKIVKMGKSLTTNKFNVKNNNNNINQKKQYFTNTENNEINTNINNNNKNNINTTLLSTYSGGDDEDYDIDRIILEKGAKLRNDFHMLLKQNATNNNFIHHDRNINTINNNKFSNQINKKENSQTNSELQNINDYSNNYQKNDSNNGIIGGTHFNIDTPMTDKMSQYSSSQNLNNNLTQENLKNNCLKLIEFYSLLNYKLKKINPKNLEIKKKLLIYKELFSTELKKNNKITNMSNLNQIIFNISTNINGPLNEKILYLFPKIKKLESNIYQCLFNMYYTDEEIIKFKEYENYDQQTKIFLLLTVIKNIISKYGNISQIYEHENFKKNILKQCLQNYDLIEKEEGDKDYVNLEELSHEIKIKNENEIKDFNNHIDDKFKVIKEVDEDKEEENDEEEEEIKDESKIKNKEGKMNNINKNNDENKKQKEEENGIHNYKNTEDLNAIHVDMDSDDAHVKDEDMIDKILIEEFRNKYKDNKYYFEKIGLNEYLYNNIKIKAIIDKDGDIKIIVEENNDEYNLDDFIKINEVENNNEDFNEYEEDNKKEDIKNENQKDKIIENNFIDLINENKENSEHINNISDINDVNEVKGKESEEEKNNGNILLEKDELNNNNENGMKKEI